MAHIPIYKEQIFKCQIFTWIKHLCCWYLVAKLCSTLYNPMNCSLPGSSVHDISQAKILEWVGCHFLPWGTFPTQVLNLCLLHWQADSLPLSHRGRLLKHLISPQKWFMNVSLCCKEQLKGKSTLDHIQIDLITDIAKHLLLKCLCPPLKAFFSPKPIVSLSLSFFHYQEFPSPDHIFQEIAKSCLSAPLVSYFLSLKLRQSLT